MSATLRYEKKYSQFKCHQLSPVGQCSMFMFRCRVADLTRGKRLSKVESDWWCLEFLCQVGDVKNLNIILEPAQLALRWVCKYWWWFLMTGPQRCCCIWGREATEKDWQRPRHLLPQRYWHLRRWGRLNWRLAWQQVSRGCLRQDSQLRVTVRVPPCQGNTTFLVKPVGISTKQHFNDTRYLAVVDWRSPQKVTLWPWPRTTTMSWSWTRSTLIRTERGSWLAGWLALEPPTRSIMI